MAVMRPSRVLSRLRAGQVASCFKVNLSCPRVSDIAALSGFDCVWLCMEHTGNELSVIEPHIYAAKARDVDVMVRVARGSYSDYIRPLGEKGSILVTFRANGLRSLALESQGKDNAPMADPGDPITVRIPMQFKRRGGRKEIIVPETDGPEVKIVAPPQESLVLALALARHWQNMLDAGKHDTVEALVKRMKVSTTYVARILRLNYLAPDIVQAILDGREPSGLSLTRLSQPLSERWDEQRARLGFRPLTVSA